MVFPPPGTAAGPGLTGSLLGRPSHRVGMVAAPAALPERLKCQRETSRSTMTKIAIVTGSVRPGRQSLNVARWVESLANQRGDATYEVVDIAEFELPLWDEAVPPSMAPGQKAHSRAWSEKVAGYD